MKWGKGTISLVVALIFGLSFIIVSLVSQESPTQAAGTWTKYSGEVTLDSEKYVVDAWVIQDDAIYKMWYTHGDLDLTLPQIMDTIGGLNLTDLVSNIQSLDVDLFLDNLSNLNVGTIEGILDGSSTAIGYATSSNGHTWTIQNSQALVGDGGSAWHSIGAPCVIKDGTTYKMWYTRIKTDLTQTSFQDLLTDLGGITPDRKAAILSLLNSTTTVIGYATSDNGHTWTVQNNEVHAGSSNSIFDSVGAPCVILDDTTYKMWFTRSKTDLTQTDLDAVLDADMANFGITDIVDLLDGTATVIGYATSANGTSWAVQDSEVLPGNTAFWDGVADPCVIKLSSTYEMWYTKGRTNLTEPNLETLLDNIVALDPVTLWNTLKNNGFADFLVDLFALDITNIEDLLDSTSTAIGHATSSDGMNWTAQSISGLYGPSDGLWSSVAAPSVVKSGTTYRMWYTEGEATISAQGILDLFLGGDLPIGYASYSPSGGGGGGITPEAPPTIEEVAEMDPDEAADALGEVGADDPEAASDILIEIGWDDPEVAGDILGEMGITDPEVAGDILEEMGITDPEVAGDILEEVIDVDPEVAGEILGEVIDVDPEVAGDILGEMDAESAAEVMEELSTDAQTDVIPEMSEEALTNTLPGLSPETLYDIWADDPAVLFDSLPNAPTEQLASEDPPEPPAEAEAPIIVYTTPLGARYLAIQTWTGEWVVVIGTPPPIDQLMIKTKQALTNIETVVEIFEERPSGITVSLPTGQIAWAYFDIRFDFATPEDIELGHITFYVEKDWIEENSVHKWSVILHRYDPELRQWIPLPTKRVEEDASNIYYTATITHFSTFAISGSDTLPPVNFEVANLVIDPIEAEIGEAITISADIINLTNEAAVYVATLWIDDTVETGQDVSLGAGETAPVSFSIIRNIEDSYEVRLDRLFGSFSVAEITEVVLSPAAFTISDLSITPDEVNIGEEAVISILVTNAGDLTDSYKVTLKIDEVAVATEDVTLAGGASKAVTFTTAQDIAGTYTVTINDLSGTFMVRAPTLPPKPINWWLFAVSIAGVIIIGVAIRQVIRRRI
ncbi:PGF-pre-PGF domain-containing protein [Chloroflexota bacterium]